MILIVGATGDLVRRVVRRLRERDESVRALVRAKTDAGQLQLQGVGGLALVNAAESAGVKRTRPAQRADRFGIQTAAEKFASSRVQTGQLRIPSGHLPGHGPDRGTSLIIGQFARS